MNILVTGGAGFIGSNFIQYMLSKYNYTIVNLDALTYAGNLDNLSEVVEYPNYHFVQGDICDSELVNSIFREYDINVVVNFAAESHVDRSINNPDVFVRTNVLGTQSLLEVSKKVWGKQLETGEFEFPKYCKFLQVSTDEVYGTLGETGKFTEKTPLAPNSPYSASKASADLMVRAYHETYGLPTNITRCSNNYGPYQFPEKLIPLMVLNAIDEKQLPVYGDGKQIRDWLHVHDHCSAIDLVIHEGHSGEIYNIGGSNEYTNLDIVKIILNKLGKSEELITHVTDRLGHDRRYAIDNTKITSELGWRPSYTFEQGIIETIEWYVVNMDWVSKLNHK